MSASQRISRDASRLPTRSNSHRRGPAPADAIAPDDKAIEDVYKEVESTGSLEAAAKKLSLVAKMRQRQQWEDDPEEAEYLAGSSGGQQDGQAQGQEQEQGEDESAVDDDEGGYYYGGGGEEDEDSPGLEGTREIIHLQEIVEGLWVGDLVAAMDTEGLEQRGISNILSLLRPRLQFNPRFAVFPLEIDDSPDTDILTHLPICVSWIGEALRKREAAKSGFTIPEGDREKSIERLAVTNPGGILVHCQAGMSRSATVTAAYLMVALGLDPREAVEMIRERRPVIDPSATFWHQLGLFHNSNGKVSLRDRSTRQFYMERTTSQFINGDGEAPPMDKMAKYPATPTPSNPPTPSGGHGRRKIRCKMCRRHLAVREHMMDHILDQAPLSRPRTPSNFALPSPRMSTPTEGTVVTSRKNSISEIANPLTGRPRSRHASMTSGVPSPMAPLHETKDDITRDREMTDSPTPGKPDSPGVPLPRKGSVPVLDIPTSNASGIINTSIVPSPKIMSRSETPDLTPGGVSRSISTGSVSHSNVNGNGGAPGNLNRYQSADQLNSRLPPQLLALRTAAGGGIGKLPSPISSGQPSPEKESNVERFPNQTFPPTGPPSGGVSRRRSLLAMTPSDPTRERRGSQSSFGGGGGDSPGAVGGIPILVNPKCSGYFVEPLTWMEPFLKDGQVAGKIVCPNEKCGAKIGNFDWAGVQCGCKEWVTPGFCISRSKVDEVW